MVECSERRWAQRLFGRAQLGDARRTARLVSMAERLAQQPAGCVSQVFRSARERQAAYDFLENERVSASAVGEAAGAATVRALGEAPFAFVPVDGTSLTSTDRARSKDFGAIGSYSQGARGLKLIHSYAVSPDGVPVGTVVQQWWARPTHKLRRKPCRALRDKETRHWVEVVEQTAHLFAQQGCGVRPWFQLDREGDSWPILRALLDGAHLFTVRGAWNRRLRTRAGQPRTYVRDALGGSSVRLSMRLHVPQGYRRSARLARLVVRATEVEIAMNNQWSKWTYHRRLHVVQVLEVGTAPAGEKPIEWLLWTNHPIAGHDDLRRILFGYSQRWRIEELHRAWKTGCRVEQTQLRSQSHVRTWATLLLTVAARAERLKRLLREQPDTPASVEFSPAELQALLLLKRDQKARNELVPDGVPTLAQAIRWIADLGGYTGKSSGGPPGAITIGRGLELLHPAALVLAALQRK